MERSLQSKLCDLRDHLVQLQLQATVQREMLDVIEEVEKRLYSTEQDITLLKGRLKALDENLKSLNHRYSDLLFALSNRPKG